LPHWLVATDTEGYIKATLKLVENHALRSELRRTRSGPDKVQSIFKGRPEIMGQMFMAALRKKENNVVKEGAL
jgi:hypothetical protein